MEKKTVWFSMFRKVLPADYEAWLEALALEGWNIEKIGQFSSMKMSFTKSAPKKYRYVFDLNPFPTQEYKDTYAQFGWEYTGQMASCFVWRKEYEDVRPESFSDVESVRKRNKRVRNAIAACLALFLIAIVVLLAAMGLCIAEGRIDKILALALETALLVLLSSYLWWIVRKIQRNLDR